MTEFEALQIVTEWEDLCLAAAEGQADSQKKITGKLLTGGALQTLPADRRSECIANLDLVVEAWDGQEFSPDGVAMLEAAMSLGWDSPILRERYALLSKTVFAKYGNPAGLAEVMQFREDKVRVQKIFSRWRVLRSAVVGAFCYDPAFGVGKIIAFDNLANEVTLQLDRKRVMNLRNFLDQIILVRKPSGLHSRLEKKSPPPPADKKAQILSALREDLLSAEPLPEEILAKMLGAEYLSVPDLSSTLILPNSAAFDCEAALEDAGGADARRWDVSRSIVELAERLKDLPELEVENPQLENVKKILASVAARLEQSEFFATSVALLQKGETYNDFLQTTLAELADQAIVWENQDHFVEICDKMPGKLVFFWMKATLLARGSAYLAAATMKMPYRLWNNTEKLLAAANQKDLLTETVFQDFQDKKVTPEHFFWLWKAPASEGRLRHLSNANLLFKALQQEAKGSYLKSHRQLRKMLLDDENFQRTILRYGETEAIRALVRSIRHLPLLDNGERQSLLVKIVRHFPEAIGEVEEKRKIVSSRPSGKFTSPRSLARSQEELRELIEVQIPENVAAIEFARSLGDLRENSEFKFAKERQSFLSRRRAELEERLSETRSLDFSKTAVKNTVVPGSSVTLKFDSGTIEKFYLLGCLDSDPDQKRISYETPLGEALLGLKIGSKVRMPSGDSATLVAIEALPAELLDWLNSSPEQDKP